MFKHSEVKYEMIYVILLMKYINRFVYCCTIIIIIIGKNNKENKPLNALPWTSFLWNTA